MADNFPMLFRHKGGTLYQKEGLKGQYVVATAKGVSKDPEILHKDRIQIEGLKYEKPGHRHHLAGFDKNEFIQILR